MKKWALQQSAWRSCCQWNVGMQNEKILQVNRSHFSQCPSQKQEGERKGWGSQGTTSALAGPWQPAPPSVCTLCATSPHPIPGPAQDAGWGSVKTSLTVFLIFYSSSYFHTCSLFMSGILFFIIVNICLLKPYQCLGSDSLFLFVFILCHVYVMSVSPLVYQ